MIPSDLIRAIVDTHKATVPLFVHGSPGIGKTSIVKAAAELLGVQLRVLRVNLLEPVDFTGLPTPDKGRVKYLTPEFFPEDNTTGILFLDELAQAPMSTQCAAMRMVDHMPDGWQVIAASNRQTDRAGAGAVATHVLSRFTHVELDVSVADWQTWALANNVRMEVRSFIDFRHALLSEFDPAEAQKQRANCSPRSWHRASRLLDTVNESVLLPLLTGTVGKAGASEFYGFLQIYRQCPSPDEILANPDKIPLPKEPSALFAVCGSLADRSRTFDKEEGFPKNLAKLVAFLVRLPTEYAALLMIDTMAVEENKLAQAMLQVPAAKEWIRKHSAVIKSAR